MENFSSSPKNNEITNENIYIYNQPYLVSTKHFIRYFY